MINKISSQNTNNNNIKKEFKSLKDQTFKAKQIRVINPPSDIPVYSIEKDIYAASEFRKRVLGQKTSNNVKKNNILKFGIIIAFLTASLTFFGKK